MVAETKTRTVKTCKMVPEKNTKTQRYCKMVAETREREGALHRHPQGGRAKNGRPRPLRAKAGSLHEGPLGP